MEIETSAMYIKLIHFDTVSLRIYTCMIMHLLNEMEQCIVFISEPGCSA